MATDKKPAPSEKKSISINGDVRNSNVFIGDNNTFIQNFFNIFKSDSETLEHRNRRILLGHVENAWIKGVLDASLHGAALLDLGIKQDPEAVTQYPWTIKKEETDEALPAGISMLDIFDSIGMGRSLLILGAPGSGKTTMLLELARGLIARAREDVTQPIPMVFNLASWTEKLTLTDWLAQELNNLYSVPRKTAPDWVTGNKLLLLLDGLDEVRQDNRAKCVEAINEFRKQNGLTSLAVCSRSQDYADLGTKLSFEGAIEFQRLTQEKITAFFHRFGDEMAGIQHVLQKDGALREMAETPLFLNIMIMAYKEKQDVEFLISGDEKERRKNLFNAYTERMLERRVNSSGFNDQKVLRVLSWLAGRIVSHKAIPYAPEEMQLKWIAINKNWHSLMVGLVVGIISGIIAGMSFGIIGGSKGALIMGLIAGVAGMIIGGLTNGDISTVHSLSWNWREIIQDSGTEMWESLREGLKIGLISGVIGGLLVGWRIGWVRGMISGLVVGMSIGLFFGIIFASGFGMISLLYTKQTQTTYPGQRLASTAKNSLIMALVYGITFLLLYGTIFGIGGALLFGSSEVVIWGVKIGVFFGLVGGLIGGWFYGGYAFIQHYTLRLILAIQNILPWRLVPFLDHCVDLIFLRRVGGGYIFIHRLLMEHFAEMYADTSK